MAMPLTVLTRVRASAPPVSAAPAISVMSVTLGLSLAHRGRPQPAVASIASRVADGSAANMCRPCSRLGQLRLTSTATTCGDTPASAAAAFS